MPRTGGAAPGAVAGDLRITLVQRETVWHDPEANRAGIAADLAAHATPTDLIVLPETFTTGFSNEAVATAEAPDGPTRAWMHALARQHGAAVVGSLPVREADGVRNRLIFARPDGTDDRYDKRHLFRMAREHERYVAGRDALTVAWRGWRIRPLVCYDLRFPGFARNRAHPDGTLAYDLLLFVANWPAPRHEAWRTLLRARAIENLAFVAGVNRTGTDGNGHPYDGGSVLADPLGEVVHECGPSAAIVTVTAARARLEAHRARFPAHLDADGFTLDA